MNKRENSWKKRVCWECKTQLSFQDFCYRNNTLGIRRAEELWFNPKIEFFCCYCYSKNLKAKNQEVGYLGINKVLIIGFPGTGKTTILKLLLDGELEDPNGLLPTRGISMQFYDINNVRFAIWDLGGVLSYRDRWFRQKDIIFRETSEIIYVIDIQDSSTYNESINYFSEIFKSREIAEIVDPKLKLYVLFHKADPDILNSPNIFKNIGILTRKIDSIKIPFKYELSKTSIYYFNPNLSEQLFNSGDSLEFGSIIINCFSER